MRKIEFDAIWLKKTYESFAQHVPQPTDADDLTQDTAELMLKRQRQGAFYQNQVQEYLLEDARQKRTSRYNQEVSIDSPIFHEAEQRLPDLQDESPEDIIVAQETSKRVKEIVNETLDTLPNKQRLAIREHFIKERRFIHIAKAQKRKPHSIACNNRVGLKRMRTLIEENSDWKRMKKGE